jgi:hypothetical protein
MDEIELAIRLVWTKLAPRLAHDSGELRRRLIRATKLRTLANPPRAWCLAIRANDTRLDANESRDDVKTRDGVAGLSGVAPSPPHPLSHSTVITLDRATIVALTKPVTLDPPGELLTTVAKKLGTTPSCLLNSRVAGVFRTSYLRTGRGKPRPLLYTDQPLDPATRGFGPPDPVWSWTATYLPSRLPRDFAPQQLTRVPVYAPRGPNYNVDPDELHPEHPRADGSTGAPQARRSLKLPPPPPDYVAYKWKDGVYVGHD